MDKDKRNFIIFCAIAITAIIALVVVSIVGIINNKKSVASNKATENVIADTQDQIGGEIVGDGYFITYEEGKKRFIITITDQPFVENQKKGEAYLKSKGVDLCKTPYLVLPSTGVVPPDNIVNGGC
jgi:hypothetical protein